MTRHLIRFTDDPATLRAERDDVNAVVRRVLARRAADARETTASDCSARDDWKELS